VRDVVGRRLSRHTAEANEILAVAAFLGREFDVTTLIAASPRPRDDVLDTLDAALATGLIREIPGTAARYAFSHALVRQTLTEEVRGARRARMHWRVGEALAAAREPELSAVAFHLCEGVLAGDAVRAAEAAVAAAEHALAAAAPEEATALAARALEIIGDEGLDAPVLKAYALVITGEAAGPAVSDVAAARDALVRASALAREHGSTDILVRAAFALTPLFTPGQPLPAAAAMCTAALDVLDPNEPSRAALLAVRGQFRYHDGEYTEGQRDVDEAITIADADGDPFLRSIAYAGRCFIAAGLPGVDAFAQTTETALAAEHKTGAERWSLRGYQGALAVRRADRASLLALQDDWRSTLHRSPSVAGELLVLVWDGTFAQADGRLDDLEAVGQEISARSAVGSPFEAFGVAFLSLADTMRGRARDLLDTVDSMFPRGQPGLDRNLHALRAYMLLQVGEHDEARACVRRALPDGAASLPPDYNRTGALAFAARVAAALDMTDIVTELLPEAQAYRGEVLVGPWGFRAYDAGESVEAQLLTALDRHDEAVGAARAGLALVEGFGPYTATSARLIVANALRARGTEHDRAEARQLLDAVVDFCTPRGIVPEAEAAEALLASL
jgi:tetratricopeptide (TPR) repeat protein